METETENIDDNDKAAAAEEANCELGELTKQNKNEVGLEEGGPDEHEHMKVVDPPPAQKPNPEEIVDVEDEKHFAIPGVSRHDAQDEEDIEVIPEDNQDCIIIGVHHGNRTRLETINISTPTKSMQ